MDSTLLGTLLTGIGASAGYQAIKGKSWHWLLNVVLSALSAGMLDYSQHQSSTQAVYAAFVALGAYGIIGQMPVYQRLKMELLPKVLGIGTSMVQQTVSAISNGVGQSIGSPVLDANSWGLEANAIYNQFQLDKDTAKAKAAVDALNTKYKGIAAPLPPGWPA